MRHILNIKLKIDKILPGLLITILIAITAKFLSNNYNVPAMLMAILIGMSLNFLSDEKRFTYGINYSSKNILYFGIVLLGSRISLDTILIIDLETILIVTLGVIFTIFFSIILLKILKFPLSFGILIGGAIAICGASAAIAISSVLPKNENTNQRLTFVVLGVTIISTVCMIFYPLISNFLKFNDQISGIFFGATIHDVAQVIGAGFMISETTGEFATLVKLYRVSLLLPLVLIISFCSYKLNLINKSDQKITVIPYFIVFFVIFGLINSLGYFPKKINEIFNALSIWFILIAISAVGTKTKFQNLKLIGFMPFLLMILVTLFLMIFIIAFL